MTASTPPTGGPPIVCRVCGTENPATRQFCRKCAADLRAPIAEPGAPIEPAPQPVAMGPVLIGGGVALAVVLILLLLLAALGGAPAASLAPSGSSAATVAAGPTGTPAAPTVGPTTAPTPAPTDAPPTAPGATLIPAPAIRSFSGPDSVDCSDAGFDGFITLTWRVADATGVTISIDGPGIYQQYGQVRGEAEVPFGCGGEPHTYLLTTVGGTGPAATRTLVIPAAS